LGIGDIMCGGHQEG